MGIETSGVNAAAQPVPAKSGTSSARADTKDDAATGGFSALLSAADAPAPSAQDAAAQANQTADTSTKSESEEGSDSTATTAAQAPLVPDTPVVDNSAMIAALLAAVQGARPTGVAEDAAPVEGNAEGKAEPLTALLNGKAGAGVPLASGLVGGADAKAATEHLKTALGDYSSVLEQMRARGEKTGAGASANSLNAAASQQSLLGKSALQAQVDLAARSDRVGNALAQATNSSQSLATAAMVATQLESVDNLASAQTRVGGVDSAQLGGLVPDRPFAHGGFTPTVQYDASAGAALAAPATSSADVADQVSYWVTQGVQNAEMTVEGANAERVHVSISLSGNEAHVSFRADQAVTREMLANSEAHLKELLGSQGLVLTGLSVANSGAGGAGQADGSGGQRQQARSQEGFAGQGEHASERAVAPTRAPAGELDLYV
jgi:flagellar hook-length control protein FliK